ncbi:MAG TPA: FAD-dependent thymidylate synthase, partial [Candidatus Paceibacterota bacterium]|nr:FAD-dependent thymidylate synthase [Candidatus Paceibacterota bacterium]
MSEPHSQYLRKLGDQLVPTVLGLSKLEEIVTDVQGSVYAFKHTFSPVVVSAAMARLSRRMGDMRTTILDEFVDAQDADALLQRVITGYGDDSVQQLAGIHLVVEGASNLLTKLLEWGRLAAYLEQSTRYIYFDQKDENGQYRYHVPAGLSANNERAYRAVMNEIFDKYSFMVRELTDYLRKKNPEPSERKERIAWLNSTRAAACDAVRPVLPAATKSTVGIFASAQAADRMIMNLLSEELPEARVAGQRLLREARKVIPTFLERTDLPTRGGAIVSYRADTKARVKELANKYLKPTQSSLLTTGQPRLASWWPDNELDLVPEILYEHSDMTLQQIEGQVRGLSLGKKIEIFKTYIGERLNRRHRPGRAFEMAHFEWELDG